MRTSLLSLSLLSTALFACGDDAAPSPSAVRTQLDTDLRHVLTEAKAASDASTKDLPTGSALSLATGAMRTSGIARVLPGIERIELADRAGGFAAGAASADDADEDTDAAFDPDAIVDMLNEKLFTDANHLGDGIYRVPASLVCGEPADQECASTVAKVDPRVRVADEDDGLRFWLQVDKNHDEPLGVLLRHDELALTVNLDDTSDAMIALAELFGEQAPNAALSGEITGSLKILGAKHALASLTFDRPISIKLADQGVGLDSPAAFRFTSAAADVLSVELDGNLPKAGLKLGLGETTIHAAAQDDFDTHATDVFLAGATVDATFAGNTLKLDNLSLGTRTSTVSVDGKQGLAIDLNGNSGRSLSATITSDPASGIETLSVSPRLDLRATIDHAVLGDDAPVYDITHVLLEGALKSSPLGDHVEVTAGRFYIETNPASFGFVSSAGDCVFATEHFDEETLASWTTYEVRACGTSPSPSLLRDYMVELRDRK